MNDACRKCMKKAYLKNQKYPNVTPKLKKKYKKSVKKLIKQKGAIPTGPEVYCKVNELRNILFGIEEKDCSEIKKRYNDLMLGLEGEIENRILNSSDPLRSAIQYAMKGNLIDFKSVDNAEASKLLEHLNDASNNEVNEKCLELLREQIFKARRLVYITDNCGEIVIDKWLMRQICRMNPNIEITVIVRGAPVDNDATMEDALQIGLTKLWCCMSNGTQTDGTVMRKLSEEAREAILKSDFVIAKGQANYETLYGCGCNIFYIFTCKCKYFKKRFKVPKDEDKGIITHENPAELINAYAKSGLKTRFEFRSILPYEAAQVDEIEKVCFMPEKTWPPEERIKRVSAMPEQFLVAVDKKTGLIAGLLNGIVIDDDRFREEFFTDVTLHNPLARTVFLITLIVLPKYRNQGLASELMKLYVIREQVRGRHRLLLTSNEEKISMFEKMGFKDLGLSNTLWDGASWHIMEYMLDL